MLTPSSSTLVPLSILRTPHRIFFTFAISQLKLRCFPSREVRIMAGTKHLEPSCLGCLFLISQVNFVVLIKVFKLMNRVGGEIKKHFSGNFLLPLLPRLSPLLRSLSFQVMLVVLQAIQAKLEIYLCQGHLVHMWRICMKHGRMIHPLCTLLGTPTSGIPYCAKLQI